MKTKIEYTLHQITVPVQTKPWPENLVEALNANVPDREQVPLPLTQDQHDGINIALSKMDLEKRTILLNLYKGGQTAQELADFYLTSVERVHLFETDGLRFLLRPECLGRIRFGEQHYLLDREMQTRRAEEKTADTDLSLEDLLVRKCRTPVENLSISVYAAHMLYFARIKTVWDLLLFFAGYPGALNRIRGVGEKNRYAFSGEYANNDWTFRTEYIHSQGWNSGFDSDKADGIYALCIAPVVKQKLHVKARYDLYREAKEWDRSKTLYEVGADYAFNKNLQVNVEYARVNDRTAAKHNYNMVDVELDFRF